MIPMGRCDMVDRLPGPIAEDVKGARGHFFVGRFLSNRAHHDASLLDAARLASLDEAPRDRTSLPFKVPAIVEPLPKAPLGHVSVQPDAYDGGEESPSAFMNFSSVVAAHTHRRLLLPLRRRECCVARPPSCLRLVDPIWRLAALIERATLAHGSCSSRALEFLHVSKQRRQRLKISAKKKKNIYKKKVGTARARSISTSSSSRRQDGQAAEAHQEVCQEQAGADDQGPARLEEKVGGDPAVEAAKGPQARAGGAARARRGR